MKIADMKQYRKEIENEYLNKGLSGEDLESALMNDPRYPQDRIIEVTGYDLENNKILGLFGNKKCEVTITQASFDKGEQTLAKSLTENKSAAKWLGHKIDENMAQSVPATSQLILQESVADKNNDVISIVTSKVIKVAAPSANPFESIFAVKSAPVANPKIVKVQHWEANNKGSEGIEIEIDKPSGSKPKMK